VPMMAPAGMSMHSSLLDMRAGEPKRGVEYD
jgi:hypothetical protein